MSKSTLPKTIKREIVIKELRAFERRLDNRLDIQTESLKDYIDSRNSQVNLKIDKLDKKLDMKVEGLVDLILRGNAEHGRMEKRIDDHEQRISTLETR